MRLACRDPLSGSLPPGYSTNGQVGVRSIGLPGETGDFFELTQIFEAAALFPVPDYLVPMTPQSRNSVELIGAGGVHVHGCLTCHSIIAFPVVASETPSFDQLELAACIVPPRKASEAGSFRRSETSADPAPGAADHPRAAHALKLQRRSLPPRADHFHHGLGISGAPAALSSSLTSARLDASST